MENNIAAKNVSETKLRGRQFLTSLSSFISILILGITYGSSSVLAVELSTSKWQEHGNSDNEDFSPWELFWIFSGNILAMIPCSWLAGILMERIGRRKLLILSFPLYIVGFLIMGLADRVKNLAIGRVICSMSGGITSPLAPVYIGEVSDPTFRGVLLSMIAATLMLGIAMANVFSMLMIWRVFAIGCAILSLIGWLTCIATRESPVWLTNTGQNEEAVKQWVHLRGWKSLEEYRAMDRVLRRNSLRRENRNLRFCWLRETFLSKHFLWSLAMTCLLSFVHQFSGLDAVSFLSVHAIFNIAGNIKSDFINVIMVLINFVIGVIACVLLSKCNRLTLAMISGIGSMCSLLLVGFFLLITSITIWTTHLSLLSFLIFLHIGFYPLSWMYRGELFPVKWRGFGAGLTSGFESACTFVHTKMGVEMFIDFGVFGTFVLYAIITAIATTLFYWKLPETRKKTLLEIDTIFDEESDEHEPTTIEMVEQEA